jgi:hypothetical protein
VTRRASVRVSASYERWFLAAGILLISTAVLTPRSSLHALHWAREHWLNAVAITAIAGVLTALGPLVIRWLDRRSGKHAGNDELSAPDMSAGPHAAPRPQPSVARLHDIVEDLRYLMGNLERAVSELTAAPDVHRRDLKVRSSLGEEVRGAGRQLEVTLRLFAADGREERTFLPPMDDTTAEGQAHGTVNSSKGEIDHTVAHDVLARVDNLLKEEAAKLERLRRQVAKAVTARPGAGALPSQRPVGVRPADAGNRPSASASSAEGGPTRPSPLPRPSPTRKRQTPPEDRRRRVGRR